DGARLVFRVHMRNHDPGRTAGEGTADQARLVVVDADHVARAPQVGCPRVVADVLPGGRSVLHLAPQDVDTVGREQLSRVGRVVAHHEGHDAASGELLLGPVDAEFQHPNAPSVDHPTRASYGARRGTEGISAWRPGPPPRLAPRTPRPSGRPTCHSEASFE